ncbi:hypothetical protein FPQ18DRAFT_393337 [Pyronema domesticum]|nr:hypothetical protein FPQ18DRAFT_393337 [Pyronema domesticum]
MAAMPQSYGFSRTYVLTDLPYINPRLSLHHQSSSSLINSTRSNHYTLETADQFFRSVSSHSLAYRGLIGVLDLKFFEYLLATHQSPNTIHHPSLKLQRREELMHHPWAEGLDEDEDDDDDDEDDEELMPGMETEKVM